MPPRGAPVARRALVARRAPSARTANNPARNASTTTDAPMSAVAINQLIETRVAEALANQEQLRNNGVNGDGSQNSRSGTERPTRTPRECTFKDFLNCHPLNFKGTEGVVVLSQWFEKMERCSRHKPTVLQRTRNSDEVENYVRWTSDMIRGNVRVISDPRLMAEQLSLKMINMDHKKSLLFLKDKLRRRGKLELRLDQEGYQQLPKRQSVAQAYAVGTGERKEYAGTLPLCNKCKFHHHGPCTVNRIPWENQAEGTEARGMAYALGGGETNQDLDNIEDDINA
ncbi:hypothetical protein Tco_0945817 [Tanacetum coccineum]